MGISIIVFLVLLSLLVFVHELGHFLAARFFGIKVEEFGFGFPPRLWGYRRKGTIYSINWLPLGGFVKIKGEQGEDKDQPDSFVAKPAWQRFTVLAAGVAMNIGLCAVLLMIGFQVGIPTVIEESTGGFQREVKLQIADVRPGSPAAIAGLESGDVLISLAGRQMRTPQEVQYFVEPRDHISLDVVVRRGHQELSLGVTPLNVPEGNGAAIGVALVQTGIVSYPTWTAVIKGLTSTGQLFIEIVRSLGLLFKNMILHGQLAANVSGPVGIAVMTGQIVQLGWLYVLQFAALLSMNLAILNFIPFPALDGGRALFLLLEKLRGRAVSAAMENWFHTVGFAVLLVMIAVITYHDILRLF